MIGAVVRFRILTCLRSWACWPLLALLLVSAAWPWITWVASANLQALELRDLPYDPSELLSPDPPDSRRDASDLLEVYARHRVAIEIGTLLGVAGAILGTLTLGFACREQLASSSPLFTIAPHPIRSIVMSEFAGTLGGILIIEGAVLPIRGFFFAMSAQPLWFFVLDEALIVGSAAVATAIVTWAERAPTAYLLATRLFRGTLASVVLAFAAVRIPAGSGAAYERVLTGWGRFLAFPSASTLEALARSYSSPPLAAGLVVVVAIGLLSFFLFDAAREREETTS